ncbi:unnamed protein product [Allacma fusca]|uniref:Uncharacterized protein n=1 Tax=Allacma fusca TaxID=39272 RepID=A0A8J2NVM8_9HEXA|nr:unnamed protein product [Allacma fusca]
MLKFLSFNASSQQTKEKSIYILAFAKQSRKNNGETSLRGIEATCISVESTTFENDGKNDYQDPCTSSRRALNPSTPQTPGTDTTPSDCVGTDTGTSEIIDVFEENGSALRIYTTKEQDKLQSEISKLNEQYLLLLQYHNSFGLTSEEKGSRKSNESISEK